MLAKSDLVALLEQKLEGRLETAEIGALAEEIARLEKDWEEVHFQQDEMGYTMSVDCTDFCALAEAIGQGQELRFFRKKTSL